MAERTDTDRRLLFVLHRAARVLLTHANSRLEAGAAVSVAQLATLSYVADTPGCSLTDVADLLDLQKSAVSSMCSRLESAGLLRRVANPSDARGAHLFSTAKGERRRARAKPVFRALLAEMTAGFSAAEIAVVLRFLNAQVQRFGSEA